MEYYSKKLHVDLSSIYKSEEDYWLSRKSTVNLKNKTEILDLTNPREYVIYKNILASKWVIKDSDELSSGVKPEATHMITNEKEEIEMKATRISLKKEAMLECSKISKDRKIEIIIVLNGKNLRGKSDDHIEVELDRLITNNTKEVLSVLKMDKNDIKINSVLIEAIFKNIITKDGPKTYYHDFHLGNSNAEVIEYFKRPENQELYIKILNSLT